MNVVPLDTTYSPFNFTPVSIDMDTAMPLLDPDLRRLAVCERRRVRMLCRQLTLLAPQEERGEAVLKKGMDAVHAEGVRALCLCRTRLLTRLADTPLLPRPARAAALQRGAPHRGAHVGDAQPRGACSNREPSFVLRCRCRRGARCTLTPRVCAQVCAKAEELDVSALVIANSGKNWVRPGARAPLGAARTASSAAAHAQPRRGLCYACGEHARQVYRFARPPPPQPPKRGLVAAYAAPHA